MFVLFYNYVDNVLERRGPHRPAHLDLVNEFHAAGTLTMAGALTDPVDSALIVFRDRESAEAFVARDPYVANGLVPAHRIREWALVVGG
ncbi:MAG TPA: YciI family protein [Tepidiformaceae bacterium]